MSHSPKKHYLPVSHALVSGTIVPEMVLYYDMVLYYTSLYTIRFLYKIRMVISGTKEFCKNFEKLFNDQFASIRTGIKK